MSHLARKEFLKYVLAAAASLSPIAASGRQERPRSEEITLEDLRSFEKIAGIEFSDTERQEVLQDVRAARDGYAALRKVPVDYGTAPQTVFTPLGGGSIPGSKVSARPSRVTIKETPSGDDLAFLTVAELSHLVRTRRVSPVDLTELYLSRLKKYGDALLCVVTLTEDLARLQARQAENEIAQGRYRGPLHGIPYGIKDLFATKGIRTTWGAEPFQDQVPDYDSAVVERLREAGAILLAKLSLGALAQGDVWFKGMTRNPWSPSQGSSGSSAGPAAATAAGLVAFSIGTETNGSIVSPSIRCRVTGLRPTFGRVSKFGAMELSYTMDKPGPICREAADCALVLAAICGADPRDPSAVDRPFAWPKKVDFGKLKIGWLTSSAATPPPSDDPVLSILRKKGAQVVNVSFSRLTPGIYSILTVESASAFDSFTRGNEIHELHNSSWPQTFRANRYVPAVEYLRAQRARTLLMQQFEKEFGNFDAVVCSGGGSILTTTNLTGHPQIVIPLKGGQARSIVGRLYSEDLIAAIAHAVQSELQFHRFRPDLRKLA